MKLIFLDIDGVLNGDEYFSSEEYKKEINDIPPSYNIKKKLHTYINPKSVIKLNKLVKETNARVIISSDWRIGFSIKEINELLNMRGATFKVEGATPIIKTGWIGSVPRGIEIQLYLDSQQDVENFIIIDDNDDMLKLSSKLILTDSALGITDNNIKQALDILLE